MEAPRVVAVTGAASAPGRLLLDELDKSAGVRRVVGIDEREPAAATRNLEFYRMDIRSPELGRVVKGCDILVHLAFDTDTRNTDEMRDRNLGGTRNVLLAAAAAGVRKVVHLSSVFVYGAHPDNDFPLTESSPVRPVRRVPCSVQAAECEELVTAFAEAHMDVTVTILRSAIILGPNVEGIAARALESPVVLGVEGYEPPFQAIHESDAATGVRFAVENDLSGVYNLCPDDHLTPEDAARITGRRRFAVARFAFPSDQASRRIERLHRLGLVELPSDAAAFLAYPWVMSGDRLRATGFTCERTTADAVREAIAAREGWVSVGRARFRPRRVAATVGSLVASALVLRGRARRGTASDTALPKPRTRP